MVYRLNYTVLIRFNFTGSYPVAWNAQWILPACNNHAFLRKVSRRPSSSRRSSPHSVDQNKESWLEKTVGKFSQNHYFQRATLKCRKSHRSSRRSHRRRSPTDLFWVIPTFSVSSPHCSSCLAKKRYFRILEFQKKKSGPQRKAW